MGGVESVASGGYEVPKGQDQVVEAAGLCRAMAEELRASETPPGDPAVCARLEGTAARLEAMRNKFFVKMAPALRYTGACLSAAKEVKAALGGGDAAGGLDEKLASLEEAVKALEGKANAPGSVTVT